MDFGPARPPWRFSRLVLRSPHLERIRERLEFVRSFFPELSSLTIRVGLVRKPGVLGWGSLDPDDPGIWVRPRRLDAFTIAHELTHLLQARNLVPRGERACDLFALARSPLLVDQPPGYLELPRGLRRLRRLDAAHGSLLHRAAVRALEARARGDRRYLQGFERDVAKRWSAAPLAEVARVVPMERTETRPLVAALESRPRSAHSGLRRWSPRET